MSSLWILTNGHWKLRRLPFQLESDHIDMGKWGKREFIKDMRHWPLICSVELTSEGQRQFVNELKNFYIGLSVWLEAYELGKGEWILDLLLHPQLQYWKPYVDLSVATLNFCRQIHSRLERAQQVDSFEALWGMCEFSGGLMRLRNGWLSGMPELNEAGRIKGKTDCMHDSQRTIKIYKNILKTGELYEGDLIKDFDPNEHLLELLLDEAVEFAVENDDKDLNHHCKQYLDAWSHYNRHIKDNEKYQIPYLPSLEGELRFTGKNQKSVKPQGFTAKQAKKGRPPKGQM